MKYDKVGIMEQVKAFAEWHASALDRILGAPDEALPGLIDQAAERIVTELDQGNQDVAQRMRALFGGQPDFWGSPLGIAVYDVVGFGAPIVPRAYAVTILGVTRQRVAQLEKAGVLVPAESAPLGLTAESVRHRWESHGPLSGGLDKEAQEA